MDGRRLLDKTSLPCYSGIELGDPTLRPNRLGLARVCEAAISDERGAERGRRVIILDTHSKSALHRATRSCRSCRSWVHGPRIAYHVENHRPRNSSALPTGSRGCDTDPEGARGRRADSRWARAVEDRFAGGCRRHRTDRTLRSAGVDVLIDATGQVEFGARVVIAAIRAGKHVVMVNARARRHSRASILKMKGESGPASC